jgi:uncharacterized protein involved in exopolysaccharide biosynthesis
VKAVGSQIVEATKVQARLENDHPELLTYSAEQPSFLSFAFPGFDSRAEHARIAALQSKVGILQKLLEKVTAEINALHEAEPEMLRLQRKKEIDEAQYRQFLTILEQARFEESLGAGRLSNIGVVQSPTPAARAPRDTAGMFFWMCTAGLILSVVLAFLFEFIGAWRNAGKGAEAESQQAVKPPVVEPAKPGTTP